MPLLLDPPDLLPDPSLPASDFGKPVTVFGMQAAHDDVIHADYHGAVVIPADAVKKLPAAIDLIARREKVILDICRSKDFSPALLRDAIKRAGSSNAEALRDALAKTAEFPGVTGQISIDPSRNASKPGLIVTVRQGKFEIAEKILP